jgi:cellulose biosynthesis protein BcsQ
VEKKTFIIMVTNGRGGVSKTNIVYSLAKTLAEAGAKTVAVDCDGSLTLTRKHDKRRVLLSQGTPDMTDAGFDFATCTFTMDIKKKRNKTRKLVKDRTANYDVAILDISGEFSTVQADLAPIVDYIVMPCKPEETMLESTFESYNLIHQILDDEEDLEKENWPKVSLARVMWNKKRLISRACDDIIEEESKEFPISCLKSSTAPFESQYARADYFGVSVIELENMGTKQEKKSSESAVFEMKKLCKEILSEAGLIDSNLKFIKRDEK